MESKNFIQRDYVKVYKNAIDIISELRPQARLQVYDAYFNYVFNNVEPKFKSRRAEHLFNWLKTSFLDRQYQNYFNGLQTKKKSEILPLNADGNGLPEAIEID